jgi:succinyl-CoA synthetase alpha subunit
MAIIVNASSRVIVQGATGTVGRAFAERLARVYPSTFVGGVAPGRGGQRIADRPIFDTVSEAVKKVGANTSIVVVPASNAADAVLEAIDAGIKVISIYTEKIPLHQVMHFLAYAQMHGVTIIGPNAAGVISAGLGCAGEPRAHDLIPGDIGIVSKSGSITYEIVAELNAIGLGVSSVCCLGGDPILGTDYRQVLRWFAADPMTRGIVMAGEIGGTLENEAAEAIQEIDKPVVVYIGGYSAPPGKPMGHAGAIVMGAGETAQYKADVLRSAGAVVVPLFEELPRAMAATFRE